VDTILVNGKYEFDISSELTNTREWASGLRNIWNGFADGDKVYISDYAEFRYSDAAGAIQFYADADIKDVNLGNAPLLDTKVAFYAKVKGTGRIEVHLDSPTGDLLTSIDFDTPNTFRNIYNKEISDVGGTRDLYFVFSNEGIVFDSWAFLPISDTDDRIRGDVNADGEFSVADAVTLQKWLLTVPNTHLADWQAADLCADNRLDVFDLCLMKRELLKKS